MSELDDDTDPDESDRLPPRILKPGEKASREAGWGDPEDWEEYEHSGTYLHGRGTFNPFNPFIQATQPTMVDPRRRTVDYVARIIWALILAAVLALATLILYVWHYIASHMHHAHTTASSAASHGPTLGSGKVFGLIVFAVVVFVGVRFILRLFRGE